MRRMDNISKQKNTNNKEKTGVDYTYQITRITHLPEDSPKETVLRIFKNDNLSEARRIALNVLQEELEWLEGKYTVTSEYEYEERKGVGYAIVLNIVDDAHPDLKNTVDGSYKGDYNYGRMTESQIFENLNLEYLYQDQVDRPVFNYTTHEFTWHYQVEIIENNKRLVVDFKAENGYRAGYEAKNFCLGRKLAQEGMKEASVDLLLCGVSPHYKKPWRMSLLKEELMLNVRSKEDQAFYYDCEPLSEELASREEKIMTILRGK